MRTRPFGSLQFVLVLIALCEWPCGSAVARLQERSSDPLDLLHEFDDLVHRMNESKVDYREDDLFDVARKQIALERAMEELRERVRNQAFDLELLAADVVRFQNSTAPRLSGRVLELLAKPAGEDGAKGPEDRAAEGAALRFRDVEDLHRELLPGDVVLLPEGQIDLRAPGGNGRSYQDVLFRGVGPERTEVRVVVENAQRVRFESLAVDCQNAPFLDLRLGGGVQLRDCLVRNYNSGEGSSNSIYGGGVTHLVFESCVFDGSEGRAADRFLGSPLDLRGDGFVLARDTRFQKNSDVLRAQSLAVFDHSSSVGSNWPAVRGPVFLRRSESVATGSSEARRLAFTTDDLQFVAVALGLATEPPECVQLAQRLDSAHSIFYWIGLQRLGDPAIREAAKEKLQSLLDPPLPEELFTPPPDLDPRLDEPTVRELVTSQLLDWADRTRADRVFDETSGIYHWSRAHWRPDR